MSEDVGAKIIGGKARARESKDDEGVVNTAYALNLAKEALEGAESSLASVFDVIQPIVESHQSSNGIC